MSDIKNVLWKNKTLGDVSIITMGQSPSSSSYNDNGIGSYLIQGNADIKDRKSSPRQWTSEPTKFCDVGDTIMTVRAPVGAIAKSMHHACIGRGVCSIKPRNIDNEFLYQFLLSCESKWKALEQGSTFTAVSGTDIKGLKLQLPPLPEQQKIADILSTVDAKIDVIDQQITETQELKKGLMQRLLTKGIGHNEFKDSPLGKIPKSWEVVKLKELGEFYRGKGISKSEILNEGQYPCIRYGEIYTTYETIITEFQSYINQESANKSITFESGDLLFTGSGETIEDIGKCVTYIGEKQAYASGDIIIHRPERGDSTFLSYYMNSPIIRSQTRKMGQGNSVVHIYVKHLSKLKLAMPPLKEQQLIAEILTSFDDKLEVLSKKKSTYKELKQGLMQQLLTGKVRVKV